MGHFGSWVLLACFFGNMTAQPVSVRKDIASVDRSASVIVAWEAAKNLAGQADICFENGKYDEAELLYKQALEIGEKTVGPEHPALAPTLASLAEVYYRQERFKEAEPLCRRSLEIRRKTLDSNHIDIAFSLNNLGEIHRATARYVSAERFFRQAIEILVRSPGQGNRYLARILNNLAALRATLGRADSAFQLYQRALDILDKSGEKDGLTLAGVLNNMAVCLMDRNQYRRAEPLLIRSLRAHETQSALESYATLCARRSAPMRPVSSMKKSANCGRRIGSDRLCFRIRSCTEVNKPT
jgi:tetratricopeptide (TPR) repeat protein